MEAKGGRLGQSCGSATTKAAGSGGVTRMEDFFRLLRELKQRGIKEAWLVGGVVRDCLMGKEPSDVDIVCDESDPLELVSKVGGSVVGRAPSCTVSTKLLDMPVEISLLTGGTLLKDLKRRDFTINAVAADAEGGIVDPFDGVRDIRDRVLRLLPVLPSPYEADPIRAVRLLRFACTLDFDIAFRTEKTTKKFVREQGLRLKQVAGERYGKEFLKGFAARPYDFLKLIEDYGMLPLVLPEVEDMRGVKQPVAFHPEGDVLDHTFRALFEAQKTARSRPGGKDVVLALAALFHDVGKPSCARVHPKYDRVCFFGHEEAGERMAKAVLSAWAVPGKIADAVSLLVRHHMIPGGSFTERTGVKLLNRMDAEAAERLFDLALCDARGAMGEGRNILESRQIFCEVRDNLLRAQATAEGGKRWVDGHDVMAILGMPPGPAVGRVLEELKVIAASGGLQGREEALEWLSKRGTQDSSGSI